VSALRQRIPWWGKILTKIVLSRLPVPYGLWRRLSLFRHGQMEHPAYALTVFRSHFEKVGLARRSGAFVALELGPGDSVASAVIARAYGAEKTYLVDVGSFALLEVEPYRDLVRVLEREGLPVEGVKTEASASELLASCNGVYLTGGVESLRTIQCSSVDFSWSHAVLEHVRRAEFLETMRELHRVLHPDGVASHRIDLRDHLAESLNNLRFSQRTWESALFATAGFYTNRLRCGEIVELCRTAGFEPEVRGVERWPEPPLTRGKLASEFRHLPDEELCIWAFDLILRKAAQPAPPFSPVTPAPLRPREP